MLRPAERGAPSARLFDNLWNDLWVKNYRLFNRWVYDQIPFPGEAYRQMIKELMWENKLMKGQLRLGGRRGGGVGGGGPVARSRPPRNHSRGLLRDRPGDGTGVRPTARPRRSRLA